MKTKHKPLMFTQKNFHETPIRVSTNLVLVGDIIRYKNGNTTFVMLVEGRTEPEAPHPGYCAQEHDTITFHGTAVEFVNGKKVRKGRRLTSRTIPMLSKVEIIGEHDRKNHL